jgi:hypothetical protein
LQHLALASSVLVLLREFPYGKPALWLGMAGVATVIEGLSRAFLDDGKLSVTEINQVFNKVDKKSKTD